MPYPRLGLVLEGDDAIEFDERMRNPVPLTAEQKQFFRDAAILYMRGII